MRELGMDVYRPAGLGSRGSAFWDAEAPGNPRRALLVGAAARLADLCEELAGDPDHATEARQCAQVMARIIGQLDVADKDSGSVPDQAQQGREFVASIVGRPPWGGDAGVA